MLTSSSEEMDFIQSSKSASSNLTRNLTRRVLSSIMLRVPSPSVSTLSKASLMVTRHPITVFPARRAPRAACPRAAGGRCCTDGSVPNFCSATVGLDSMMSRNSSKSTHASLPPITMNRSAVYRTSSGSSPAARSTSSTSARSMALFPSRSNVMNASRTLSSARDFLYRSLATHMNSGKSTSLPHFLRNFLTSLWVRPRKLLRKSDNFLTSFLVRAPEPSLSNKSNFFRNSFASSKGTTRSTDAVLSTADPTDIM
mmetsp:Transcript_33563/g.106788  ORF Transcript_33563/g.106788 Transcript_33563/m.106788 type:complete len:255 (-) Transcript_33563:442-1206(-)